MFKVVAILAFVAVANAGVAYVDHRIDDLGTVGQQSEQTVRGLGFGGLSTVSHQSKAVDSAYSSVRKHDTRVINPAVYASPAYAHYGQQVAAAPVAYHQPAVYAAPAVAKVAAPLAYAAPAHYAHYGQVAAAPVAYHQPAVYAAPAVAKVAAPLAVAQPAVYSAAHPVAHAAYAPAVAAYNAPAAATTGSLLGVKYSAVPQVAHLSFDGFGAHYSY